MRRCMILMIHVMDVALCRPERPVHVFYHVFKSQYDSAVASRIVNEQLMWLQQTPLWKAVDALHFATIGDASIKLNVSSTCDALHDQGRRQRAACIHLGHNETGMEEITLGYLHRFCLAHPEQLVAYVHTKGSYHNHAKNVQMRQFLLHSLASEECLDGVSNGTCSVCSARFAAAPQPHVPGNMWLARCDYVSRLVQPRSFGKLLAKSSNVVNSISLCRERGSPLRPHRVGTGRFASEHWINSHPTVSPCDTSARVDYQRGYGNIPPLTDPISLALAPRWPLRTIDGHRGSCNNPCKGVTVNMCSKQWQVAKWKDLYPDAVSSAQIELWKQGRLFADALGR